MKLLSQHIESLIFTSEKPLKLKEIKSILEETFETKFKNADLENALEEIGKRYESNEHSFEMVGIAEGYQFLTKGSYFNTVATFLKQTTRKRLSRAALETLSIIAYKQPVSRPELERIRGVSCDYAIHKLLEKEMVTILGRSESPGRPLLYGTSEKFMDYFGLKTLNDMPKPKDFNTPENSIGEAAPIEEDTPNPNFKPQLELPITALDEVVDMLAAILPEGPKLEIEEEEVEEETSTPMLGSELELPVNDLEEVVDMIAAVLPKEAKIEEQSMAVTETSNPSSSTQPKESSVEKKEPTANIASTKTTEQKIPQASGEPTIAQLFTDAIKTKTSESDSGSSKDAVAVTPAAIEKPVQESPQPQPSKEKEGHPTIAQLFAEAIKIKAPNKSDSGNSKDAVVVTPMPIEKPIQESLSPQSSKEQEEHPTITQLFNEAIKSKTAIESSDSDTNKTQQNTPTNELDGVVDVITASMPVESIPSKTIVLEELIKKGMTSSEEE